MGSPAREEGPQGRGTGTLLSKGEQEGGGREGGGEGEGRGAEGVGWGRVY